MTVFDTTAYFLTLVAIAMAPGPVVLMLMARAACNDVAGATGFGVGFALGGVAIIIGVCFGLSHWLDADAIVFSYGKYVMLAYILWLARGIWKSGFNMDNDAKPKARGVVSALGAGACSCLISPYMMLLFPMVLPGIVDVSSMANSTMALVISTTFLALGLGAALIILFASQIRRLAKSPDHFAILNKSLACILASAGGWMALT